jgi:hypothetical protein
MAFLTILLEGESPLIAPMEYGDRAAVSLEGFAIDDQGLVHPSAHVGAEAGVSSRRNR